MPVTTNSSLPVLLDGPFGLYTQTAISNSTTTNASNAVTVTGDTVNIPTAGYVLGAGIPAGTTYTRVGTAVTLSAPATATGAGVALTYSKWPTTFYFALFTATPNAGGGGTEVAGGSYARVPVTNNSTNFGATGGNNKTNLTAINWPTSTAAWGTVVAWGIFDAAAGGNLFFYGSVTNVALNNGDTVTFPVGFFDLTF